MEIIYVSNTRFPTKKAHGINIIKTCEALALRGVEVTLIVPRYKNSLKEDGISYAGGQKGFQIKYIPVRVDVLSFGWFGYWMNRALFALGVLFAKELRESKRKIILTRDELSVLSLRLLGHIVFYDLHGFPARKQWFWKHMVYGASGFIVTSNAKVERCMRMFKISREKIVVAPNGFDPALFSLPGTENKKHLRKKLLLPENKNIILYTGHLYDWKGASVLAETAKALTDRCFVFVGGTLRDVENFSRKYGTIENIIIKGYEPHERIPQYLKSADVLVLPNSRKSKDKNFALHSEYDTVPIKLFEYMASGTPIVASDLPSIREFLDEESTVFVEADNPKDLESGIEAVLRDSILACRISERARVVSAAYTWEMRAEKIINFVENNS